MDIGAHDYIEKPIRDVEDLRSRVRRAPSPPRRAAGAAPG